MYNVKFHFFCFTLDFNVHFCFVSGKSITAEDYVVKVEPHSNGPLFVELHFYCRATKKEDLDSFAASKKIKHLGVPDLKGHGSFMHRKKKLRFIVMPRYEIN